MAQRALRDICKPAGVVSVPETSVDKDCRAVLREDNVRFPGEASGVQPEPVAHPVEQRPNQDLGLCVLRPDPGHVPDDINEAVS